MSMTIGRAAIATDPAEGSLAIDGDLVSFTAILSGITTAECQARIAQLAGLVGNNDEPVVPFTWSADANFDGFYRVESLQVQPMAVYLLTGQLEFAISLGKVTGFGRPQFESVASSVVRINAHGVTAPTGIVVTSWIGGDVASWDTDYASTGSVIDTEDGSSWLERSVLTAPQPPKSRQWSVYASAYYQSTAKIEIKLGSSWYPWVGTQPPAAVGLNWRISNGVVRFTPSTSGSSGTFLIETYSSGAWAGTTFKTRLGVTVVPLLEAGTTPAPFRIVRNSPEAVVVRVRMPGQGVTCDIGLRRGDSWIEMSFSSAGIAWPYGIDCASAIASTAFTGGIRATANDANGRRFLISCPSTITTDLVNGSVKLTTGATAAQFQVTADYQKVGISGVTPGTDTGLRDYFLAARTERVRVVSR